MHWGISRCSRPGLWLGSTRRYPTVQAHLHEHSNCAAAVGKKVYIFGGHVWVKQMRGLQKFDDFWVPGHGEWAF